MTTGVRQKVKCNTCKVDMRCPKCNSTQLMMTPFSHLIRARTGKLSSSFFDNENLDYIWFQYRDGWFITIEEKQYGGISSPAQKDTHGMISQMLRFATDNGCEVDTFRGRRKIEYRGHYIVRLENTTPSNSAWIEINGKMFSENRPIAVRAVFCLLENGAVPKMCS